MTWAPAGWWRHCISCKSSSVSDSGPPQSCSRCPADQAVTIPLDLNQAIAAADELDHRGTGGCVLPGTVDPAALLRVPAHLLPGKPAVSHSTAGFTRSRRRAGGKPDRRRHRPGRLGDALPSRFDRTLAADLSW